MAGGARAPEGEIIGEMNEEEKGMLRNLATAKGAAKTELLRKIQEYAAENVEAWKKQKVYMGIVGESGAGKSTFINSFRGLKPMTPGAAEVGLSHTTLVPIEYPHPARPESFVFVDFPGVLLKKGTGDQRDFDIQQYLTEFGGKMEQCHVFLVFSSGRIQHNAVQIGMKARDMGKKVLFVRSQFDIDVVKRRNDNPNYFKEKNDTDLMEELRQDYIQVLKKVGWEGMVDPRDVFIISGLYENVLKGSWDIPKFRKAMIEGLDALQKMVVINTCRDFSKNTIKERGDIYRSHVWKVAMAATAGSFVPYAGLASVPAAVGIAYKQYKEGFGLTEDAVRQLAKMTNKNPEDLKKYLSTNLLHGATGLLGASEALAVFQAICSGLGLVAAFAVDQAVDLAVPVIGALVTAPLAFGLTCTVLLTMISRMEKCASNLFDYALGDSAV